MINSQFFIHKCQKNAYKRPYTRKFSLLYCDYHTFFMYLCRVRGVRCALKISLNIVFMMKSLSVSRLCGRLFVFVLFLSLCLPLCSAVRLPRLFSDGAVLQRERPLTVWGWADSGETVTVKVGRQKGEARAGADGRWSVVLSPQKAGGPYVLEVTAPSGSVAVKDIWMGDVWLCSGQSNIDTHIERVYPQYPEEIDHDSTDRVRLFKVENVAALDGPRSDVVSSGWKTLSKKNAWHTTAIGYFLGKRMAAETGVVQGIVQSSWGGTPIEAWLPRDTMEAIAPLEVMKARLYNDEDLSKMVAAANGRASQRWNNLLEETDPGVKGRWIEEAFDDSAWPEAEQTALPIAPGRFCGSYWVRQHIHVDAAHAGKAALLRVGTLVDADFTYLNGRQVGSTGYQYPPRRYAVPAGLLHEGENTLVVRFVNRNGAPSFVPEKPYRLEFPDGHQIPLSSRWRVHDGTQMPSQPSFPTGAQNMASAEWNGMLSPLAPLTLSGVVWYQGESNTNRPASYERSLRALMASWRGLFQQPELPFAVVQLANFMAPSTEPQQSNWARLRESQRRAVLSDDHARLVVILDLGEANDIHPLRKKEVAARIAQVFDHLVFNNNKVQLSPQPLKASQTSDGVVIQFDQPVQPGALHGFELAGSDGRFRNVLAVAKGNQVTLRGEGRLVRYAWKDNPMEADCRGLTSLLPATSFEIEVW